MLTFLFGNFSLPSIISLAKLASPECVHICNRRSPEIICLRMRGHARVQHEILRVLSAFTFHTSIGFDSPVHSYLLA
jgi:hypothetical protein